MSDAPAPVKLHLGCGHTRMDGWVNCDLYAAPNVDIAFDAQQDWPFPDSSADAVYASHMLEHLTHPLAFFREAWRVLKPVGGMKLRVPYGGHNLAWVDLTHVRPWYAETFCVLQPGYEQYTGNPQHAAWQWPFGVTCELRVSGKFARLMAWWPIRKFLLTYNDHIANFIEELWVHLWPLKTEEAVRTYWAAHEPNAMARQYVMYRHQWERRGELKPGDAATLVHFGGDESRSGYRNWA